MLLPIQITFGPRKAQADEPVKQTTEDDVIAYVRGINDEEYKKLSKKFTAFRNLEKDLRSIEDGDLEDALAGMSFENTDASKKELTNA